jgi:hypothetical protein
MTKLTNVAAATLVFAAALTAGVANASGETDTGPAYAQFEGHTIDLSVSWGAATACAELGELVDCYRTEAELLDAHPELDSPPDTTRGARQQQQLLAACSSSLRLYSATGYSGNALHLTTRYVAINLSTYGFDNMTSSYRVGACAAAFYSGANLGGTQYPGSTAAGVWSATMTSGWNNVVSSVLIF